MQLIRSATFTLPGQRHKKIKVTVTLDPQFEGRVWLDRVQFFGESWEGALFFDEKPKEFFMYSQHGKKKLGPKEGFGRSCWSACAGLEDGGGICHIHNPNVKIQAVDLKVPAVSWNGKWWVVDATTAQRLAREMGSHGKR